MSQNDGQYRETGRAVDPEVLPPETEYGADRGRQRVERVISLSSFDSRGCASPAITLFLFMILLVQFGLLAAIGFGFFYTCGAILGAMRMTRALVMGRAINPWVWATGNWCVSFLLTVWLAGGFES